MNVLIIQMVIKTMGVYKIMRETIEGKMRKGTNSKSWNDSRLKDR